MAFSRRILAITIFLALFTSVPATPLSETGENVIYQANGIFEGFVNGTPSNLINGTINISINSLNSSQGKLTFADSARSILSLSALILGLVNGFILFRNYLRDKPRLEMKPVEPDTQWVFTLPSGEYQGHPTRKHGFLAYIKILNRGLRDVSLDSWNLIINTVDNQKIELKPLSIPQPQIKLGSSENLKLFPVLGQPSKNGHGGNTMIKSGDSVSGFAYYIAEFYGSEGYNISITDGKIRGKAVIESVLGDKANIIIIFNEITLEEAKKLIKDIDNIH